MNRSLKRAVEWLIQTGRRLDQRGWVLGGSGNFSIRLNKTTIAVTASGVHKGMLREDDILLYDLKSQTALSTDGQPAEKKPSSDIFLHSEIYQLDPSANSVLHVHSVPAVVVPLKIVPAGSLLFRDSEVLKTFPGPGAKRMRLEIPIFDKDNPTRQLQSWWEQRGQNERGFAFLIWKHGLYCWADTPEESLRRIEALNYLLELKLEFLRIGLEPDIL